MHPALSGSRTSATHFLFTLSVMLPSLNFIANVAAQEPPAVSAPSLVVGDRWTWNIDVSNRDECSNIAKGSQTTETVSKINDGGYVIETVGPGANTKYSRTYLNDGSYMANLDGKEVRSSLVAFPLRPGNKWETTLVSALAVTSLNCKAGSPERVKAAGEDLEVIPITCNGNWKNRKSGNEDSARYEQWYSPSIGASVRRTVWTRWGGKICTDIDYRLESYTRSK